MYLALFGTIETFAKCVTAWIIQGSEELFYTVHFTECLNDVRVEASALIAMDS